MDDAVQLAMPLIGQMEARSFEQTKGMVAMRVLSLASDTRKAWINALGAIETVRCMRQVKDAADASAELAQAEQAQRSSRERLTRLLGAWGAQTRFSLPERLPDLPKAALDLLDVERVALAQRLDVQGAKTRPCWTR